MIGQRYGIKFPIQVKSGDGTLVDLNQNQSEQIKSEIMHILFTPKGQRLRKPDFGSTLIQYIFSPNDSQTWGNIKSDLKEMIKRYIPNVNLDDIQVYETDGGMGMACRIRYEVMNKDGSSSVNEVMTRL